MSGRNQHHVWKYMQLGFADPNKKGESVWVYRRGQRTFFTNPRNHGAIRDFYEDGKEMSADDVITNFENSLAPIIGRMRNGEVSELDQLMIPSLISHLEVRSLFLREKLTSIAGEAVEEFVNEFIVPGNLKRLMFRYFKDHPNLLEEKFELHSIPEDSHKIIQSFVDVNLEAELDQMIAEKRIPIDLLLSTFKSNLTKNTIEAHNRAISESGASPETRTSRYSEMVFRIQSFDSGGLILPDTCTLFVTKSNLKPAITKDDQPEAVVVPISHNTAIVGSMRGAFSRELPVLNSMLASVSYEAFVGAREANEFEKLKRRIGKNAILVSGAELKRTIRKKIKELL